MNIAISMPVLFLRKVQQNSRELLAIVYRMKIKLNQSLEKLP